MPVQLSGSLDLSGSLIISGSITSTGGIVISGSIASASYASNADLLDGRDSTIFATTGSNIFSGNQTVCANLTTTGTITAQTINVQQVTSSIVYSSGSNVFGNLLTDRQQMTGSVTMTGSLVVQGPITNNNNACFTSICSPSHIGGTFSGTTLYGSTAICGGVVCGTSATFSSNVTVGNTTSTWFANARVLQIGQAGALYSNTTITQMKLLNNVYYDASGNPIYINNGYAQDYTQDNTGQHIWYTAPTGTAAGAVTLTPRLIISNTGEACFACQVCAPNLLISNCATIGTVGFSYPEFKLAVTPTMTVVGNGAGNVSEGIYFKRTSNLCQGGWINGNGGALNIVGQNKHASSFGDIYFSSHNGTTSCDIMVIDGTNRRVGIGCTTPSYALDVRDGTTGSAGGRGMRLSVCSNSAGPQFRLEYQCSGDSRNWLIGTNQEIAGDFIIRGSTVAGCDPGGTCSIARLSILKEGYVGIGNIFPCTNLVVEGVNKAFPLSYNTGWGNLHIQTCETTATQNYGGSITFGGLGRTSGPTEKFIWAAIAGRKETTTSGDPKGYLQFGTLSDDTNEIKERMRITSGGSVCIGTAAVSGEILRVNGCSCLDNYISVYSGTIQMFLDADKTYSAGIVGTQSNHPLFLRTNGTNRLGISTAGVLDFPGSNSTATSVSDTFSLGVSSTSYAWIQSWGGRPLRINESGNNVNAYGTNGYGLVNTTASDLRIKKNIQTIENALDKVNCLRGVYYEFDNDNCMCMKVPGGKRRVGLIAQEVEQILPEAVLDSQDCSVPLSLDYGGMIGLLSKAIQEQQCKIKTLESCLGIN